MSRNSAFIVCSFTSTDHLRGSKRTYENIKKAALEAGRFSTFEATENMRNARMFTRLCKDPEVEVYELHFPWTGVRRKGEAQATTSLPPLELK